MIAQILFFLIFVPEEVEIGRDLGAKTLRTLEDSDPEAVLRFKLATATGLIDDSDSGCLVSAITWFPNICIGLRGELTHELKSAPL